MNSWKKIPQWIAILVVLFLNSLALIKLTNAPSSICLSFLTLITSSRRVVIQASALIVCVTLQFSHANSVAYYFENMDMLAVRYGNIPKMFKKLFFTLFKESCLYTALLITSFFLATRVTFSPIKGLAWRDLLGVVAFTLTLCTILYEIQLVLMLWCDSTTVFITMTLGIVVYSYLLSFLPVTPPGNSVFFADRVFFKPVIIILGYLICKKIYKRRWGHYANKNR